MKNARRIIGIVGVAMTIGGWLGREWWIKEQAMKCNTALHDFLVLHALPGTHEQMFGEPEPILRDELDDEF